MIQTYKTSFFKIAMFALLALSFTTCKNDKQVQTQADEIPKKPNIITIVTDDLGWYDLASYGNTFIETPNLDQLGKDGIRFTDGYAPAPLCSASRSAIITGLHPIITDITEHIHGNPTARPDQKLATPPIAQQLDLQFTTTAEILKKHGYQTGFFGKWHLGGGKFTPDNRGFDVNIAGAWNGLPQSFFWPFFPMGQKPELQNSTKEGDYLTDVLTDKAMDFITKRKDSSFYVSLNYYSPHVPIEGKPELVEKYKMKRGADSTKNLLPNAYYAAMVESIDQNVGRLVKRLDSLGLSENTLIIFTSDNGGLHVESIPGFDKHTPPTTNGPLREGKGFVYEGGIREPLLIKWPAVITKNRVDATPIIGQDFHNTFMEIVGAEQTEYGKSLLPLLKGEEFAERGLLWHMPHYNDQGSKPSSAYRKGDWKLVYNYETKLYELFNLKKDLSESINLAETEPEKFQELKTAMESELTKLNAKYPTPNPNYNAQD